VPRVRDAVLDVGVNEAYRIVDYFARGSVRNSLVIKELKRRLFYCKYNVATVKIKITVISSPIYEDTSNPDSGCICLRSHDSAFRPTLNTGFREHCQPSSCTNIG
jgi:hypothetical protein